MYSWPAQAVHRNRESSADLDGVLCVADFTEVVLKPTAYSVSGRSGQFLFLVMSLSGSQTKFVRPGCNAVRHPVNSRPHRSKPRHAEESRATTRRESAANPRWLPAPAN